MPARCRFGLVLDPKDEIHGSNDLRCPIAKKRALPLGGKVMTYLVLEYLEKE